MIPPSTAPLFKDTRSDWVRLQTLTSLRWLAIGGQLLAMGAAIFRFDLEFPVVFCLLTIFASVLANLIAEFRFPQNQRLTEMQALTLLLFDLSQLSLLLFLTGGLTNPFAILLLAPITISASALDVRSTVLLGGLGMVYATVLALWNVPLHQSGAPVLEVPPLLQFGFWAAIVIAILFIGSYQRRVASEIRAMSDAVLAAQMALAREQKLTDLGGVVAAAAHELGTPLATIKLVSTEMIDELSGNLDLQEDARLIRQQADRCRDILRSMGQRGKDDLHLHQAPLLAVIRESAEPHLDRGKEVIFQSQAGQTDRQPAIFRQPEIIHGLRNLVQNAVDFARSRVWVDASWSEDEIHITVSDDGAGYPPQMIGRIGNPFLRARPAAPDLDRPEYEGMGLGLFIAKTLLERTGAQLHFSNGTDSSLPGPLGRERSGAHVDLRWRRDRIEATSTGPLGENQPVNR